MRYYTICYAHGGRTYSTIIKVHADTLDRIAIDRNIGLHELFARSMLDELGGLSSVLHAQKCTEEFAQQVEERTGQVTIDLDTYAQENL